MADDIAVVAAALGGAESAYLWSRLQAALRLFCRKPDLVERMETALAGRPLVDYTALQRPSTLPPELVFKEGESVPTRKASEAWFAWAMKNTRVLLYRAPAT